MEDDDKFLDFEPKEKNETESNIQTLSERVEKDVSLISGKINLRDYDYITISLILGEIILIFYGLLILLKQVQIF